MVMLLLIEIIIVIMVMVIAIAIVIVLRVIIQTTIIMHNYITCNRVITKQWTIQIIIISITKMQSIMVVIMVMIMQTIIKWA
jgi:hypothetical protein